MRKESVDWVKIGLAIILLCSCASMQSQFQKAQQLDRISAYEEFIDKYPKSELADSSQRRIDELRFLEVKGVDKFRAYQKFLAEYPDNRFADEARSEMEKFEVVKLDSSITRKWSDFPEIGDIDFHKPEGKFRLIVQARMKQCWNRAQLDKEHPLSRLPVRLSVIDMAAAYELFGLGAEHEHCWIFDGKDSNGSIIIEPIDIKLSFRENVWRNVENNQPAWVIIGWTEHKKNLIYETLSLHPNPREGVVVERTLSFHPNLNITGTNAYLSFEGDDQKFYQIKMYFGDVETCSPIFGVGSELRFDTTDWVNFYGVECRSGGVKISELGAEFLPGTEIAEKGKL